MGTEVAPVEILTTAQCWELLRTVDVGRLARCAGDGPEILPVNVVVDHGSLVFRTGEGSPLALTGAEQVAFESDGFVAAAGRHGTAWSVLVKGTAHRIGGLHDLVDSLRLPVHPWHDGPKHVMVRIEPTVLTGRRFAVRGRPRPDEPGPVARHE